MEFVLVVIDGPQKGRGFLLGEETCSIGRDQGNLIQTPEHSASRQHCAIRRQSPEIFLLTDLGSRNGTFRNGAPVSECALNDGDEIQVGDTRFLFLARDSQAAAEEGIRFDDQDPPAETVITMAVEPEERIYLRLGQNEADAAEDSLSKGVALLWVLASRMSLRPGLQHSAEYLLQSLRDCLPAGYLAVMLFENGSEAATWICTDPADLAASPTIPFPKSLIRKVLT